ncbi:hypothetical protein P3S68_032834 [Capsicum galapagoense]
MAHKFSILLITLLVVISAHDSFYSSKTHVMAQEDQDPTCGKPCSTHDDCSNGSFCQACWNSRGTCGPFVG